MKNILFTCAGRRNYLINYFKEALNGKGKIFAADMSSTAPAMVDADIALIVPSIYADNYIDTLKNIIDQKKIDALISLNDLELPILSKHKSELESTGAKIIVSDTSVIDICFDKMKTFNFIKSIGLNTPLTYTSLSEVENTIMNDELNFPLIVKPRWGSASIGIDIAEDWDSLKLIFKYQQLKLKKSILSSSSKEDMNNAILIQESMNGDEYGLDVLNDFEGNYIGTFVRKKINMRSGETDIAISVIDKRFEELGKIISENLRHIGNLDCDVFLENDVLYVLELNPRFGGGYPFSHEAGINSVAIYLELLNGGKNVHQFNNYIEGQLFSKCDRLLKLN